MFKKCDLITTPEHTGLLRVMNNAKKILYVAFLNPQTDQVICYGHLHVSKATHATLEEIAAGHRIDHFVDINDMGDDSHIENHVSPNCKMGVK